MEKLIFGFYTDGDGARLEINGDIADLMSGFVLAFTVNPEIKDVIKKSLDFTDNMDEDIMNLIKDNVSNEAEDTEADTN